MYEVIIIRLESKSDVEILVVPREPLLGGGVDCFRRAALGVRAVRSRVADRRVECLAPHVEFGAREHAHVDLGVLLVHDDEPELALVRPHPYHLLVRHGDTV